MGPRPVGGLLRTQPAESKTGQEDLRAPTGQAA